MKTIISTLCAGAAAVAVIAASPLIAGSAQLVGGGVYRVAAVGAPGGAGGPGGRVPGGRSGPGVRSRGGRDHGKADREIEDPVLKKLDLSRDQRKQIGEILKRHEGEMEQLGELLNEARQKVVEAEEAEVYNEQALRDACKALATAIEEFTVTRANIREELNQVLTSDQREKANELRAKERKASERRSADSSLIKGAWLGSVAGK